MKIQAHIRFAKSDDIHQIIDLCKAHAIYEQCGYSKEDKATKLANYLFSNSFIAMKITPEGVL